jgi:hypothetical protein
MLRSPAWNPRLRKNSASAKAGSVFPQIPPTLDDLEASPPRRCSSIIRETVDRTGLKSPCFASRISNWVV